MSQSLHLKVRVDLIEVRIEQALPKTSESRGIESNRGRLIDQSSEGKESLTLHYRGISKWASGTDEIQAEI